MNELFVEKMRLKYESAGRDNEVLSEIDDAVKIENQYEDTSFEDVARKIGVVEEDINSYCLKKAIEEL